jgi:hypothetical protein
VSGTIHIIGRNEIFVIVEMRILEFLVPLRARFDRMFRLLGHGLMGRASVSDQLLRSHYMRRNGGCIV